MVEASHLGRGKHAPETLGPRWERRINHLGIAIKWNGMQETAIVSCTPFILATNWQEAYRP